MIKNAAGVALSLAVACSLSGCQSQASGAREPFQGVIEHDDREIGFELAGRVVEVDAERGQHVEAGRVVARLDDSLERPQRELRAADLHAARAELELLQAGSRIEDIRAAQAQVDALQAQEDIARKNADRQRKLLAQGALAPSVLDETTAQLEATVQRKRSLIEQLKALRRGARGEQISAALARVEAARAALAAIDARLSRYRLVTLAEGDVVDVHVERGEMVAAGAPAVTLADLDHPYVDVFVPQARMNEVRRRQQARVRVDGTAERFAGRVEHIFPDTEFTPRYLFSEEERANLVVRVRVRVTDPEHRLHAGVPAFVTLREDTRHREEPAPAAGEPEAPAPRDAEPP